MPLLRKRATACSFAGTLAFGCLYAPPLLAEVSGSVAAVSDYRFRGISLSDGGPSLLGDLNFDSTTGAYLGAFAASTRLGTPSRAQTQWVAYCGFARRLLHGPAVDLGASYAGFTQGNAMGYAEAHGGITWDDVDMRLHYSPDYFRSGARTLYIQVDASRVLAGRSRAFVHLGGLRRLSGGTGEQGGSGEADLRAGVSLPWSIMTARISWGTVSRISSVYPIQAYDGGTQAGRSAWVAQLSGSF